MRYLFGWKQNGDQYIVIVESALGWRLYSVIFAQEDFVFQTM